MRNWLTPAGSLLLGAFLAAVSLPTAAQQAPLRVAYVNWSSSVASANLVCAMLDEELGRSCELIEVTAEGMWKAVASGEADVMLSAWLPDTHGAYLEEYGDRMVDLGPNLEGTRTGLVVPAVRAGRQTRASGVRNPAYVGAESIADLRDMGDRFGRRIIGIDPGAGVMQAARRAMDAYDLDTYRLIDGSELSMTDALSEAIARQEPIVVTGWVPHWMFDRWSLRFLDDPENVFGGTGRIHTMVRKGLAADMPRLHGILDRFYWNPEDMNRLLIWNRADEGLDPYGNASRWLRAHPGYVAAWLGQEEN
ncbi:MAG: glycine betaine ABC transporter substrate-binding protein [Anaerolineae bacterium]